MVELTPQRPWVYHLFRTPLLPFFRFYFQMQAEGLENVPGRGSFIMTPNHVSMLDWAFLLYFFPRPGRFVVHQDYYDMPLLRTGLRINGAIPIYTERPGVAAIRALRSALERGDWLILFPEGGISLNGRPQTAFPGVISLAASAKVPIVPAAIRGAFEAFPRWRKVPHPGRVSVVFGRALPPPPRLKREEQQIFAARLMEYIAALHDGNAAAEPPW